jgi:beta-fructofuranosidase
VVTSHHDFNFGPFSPGGVHAPSATPDGQGGVIAIFNMNPAKPTPGWDQIMTLPRRLTLAGSSGIDRDQLLVEPAGDVTSLRGAHHHVGKITLPANEEVVLDTIAGHTMEIIAEIDPGDAPMVEMNVLRSPGREEFTRIAFYKQRGNRHWERYDGWGGQKWQESRDSLIVLDNAYASTLPDVRSRAPETAPVFLAPDEPLTLRVFIDRSVVEVFVNGKQCVALRVYPGREDSLGVSLRAQGQTAVLRALDAWQLNSIYD